MMQKATFFDELLQGQIMPRREVFVGIILAVALFAFELFNFDTTQFALGSLLGDVRFLNLPWAAILAIAFCSIDFAGLIHFFSPSQEVQEVSTGTWFLIGAWFLGATMNALMTWWAVSLTLLNHSLGNEILSREQLLNIVPIFVAVLVWLTRILFIGGLTIAGNRLFQEDAPATRKPKRTAKQTSNAFSKRTVTKQASQTKRNAIKPKPFFVAPPPPTFSAQEDEADDELEYVDEDSEFNRVVMPATSKISHTQPPATRSPVRPTTRQTSRTTPKRAPQINRRQRPPMPPINNRLPLRAKSRN